MATPVTRVVNPDAPANQQTVLVATKEAHYYRVKKDGLPQPSTGHAEPGPCSTSGSPWSRVYSRAVASDVPGKAGDAIWPV